MIIIDDTNAVVFNTDDLQNAVSSDNGIDHVYFGADITLAYGITIYPNKPSLIFDGTHEGVMHTFTDMNSTDLNYTIGIRSVSNISITFQNINLIGRNFFGIPYVPNSSEYYGVSTLYHNVTYNGTQLTHNPYGFARYDDCNITVNNHEAAEINRLEISGLTTIRKINSDNAVFWFHGSSIRRPSLKILSGAVLAITTAHYFMFESYPPDFTIESDADFTLNTNSGIALNNNHTVASFQVEENASFRYTQNTNTRNVATLNIDGALTVNEDATFYMQTDFANTNQLIRFTGGSAGMYLNNPRSFVLYNKGNASATAFSFTALTPFVFVGNQVNYWDSSMAFPAAGTFDDEPRYKWNKLKWNQLRIEGRAGSSQTYIDSHNFTQEELDKTSALTDLRLHLARVFSVGNLPLSVNRIVIGTKRITGKTTKKAKVRVLSIAAWSCPDCDADNTGLFSVTPIDPVPSAEIFTITSNTPFLLTSLMAESQEEGRLSILSAPESIGFSTHPLEGVSEIILPRQIPDAPVIVLDERADKTQWVIWAKIAGPLRTEENDILDNTVVFAPEEGDLITLGNAYIPIHTDGPYLDVDETPVTWADSRGVLARITVPIRSGRRYSTQLDWAVYPMGVQPVGGE